MKKTAGVFVFFAFACAAFAAEESAKTRIDATIFSHNIMLVSLSDRVLGVEFRAYAGHDKDMTVEATIGGERIAGTVDVFNNGQPWKSFYYVSPSLEMRMESRSGISSRYEFWGNVLGEGGSKKFFAVFADDFSGNGDFRIAVPYLTLDIDYRSGEAAGEFDSQRLSAETVAAMIALLSHAQDLKEDEFH